MCLQRTLVGRIINHKMSEHKKPVVYEETYRDSDGRYGQRQHDYVIVPRFEPIALFDGARFDERGDMTVTPKVITSQDLGQWILRVKGKGVKPKERDDYGAMFAYVSQDQSRGFEQMWAPHLYPWESVSDLGLPEISDRDRLALEVTLTRVLSRDEIDPPATLPISLHTSQGVFLSDGGGEDGATAYSMQLSGLLYRDFVHTQDSSGCNTTRFTAEEVSMYPVKVQIPENMKEYYGKGTKTIYQYDDFGDRRLVEYSGGPRGVLWVPRESISDESGVAELTIPRLQVEDHDISSSA